MYQSLSQKLPSEQSVLPILFPKLLRQAHLSSARSYKGDLRRRAWRSRLHPPRPLHRLPPLTSSRRHLSQNVSAIKSQRARYVLYSSLDMYLINCAGGHKHPREECSGLLASCRCGRWEIVTFAVRKPVFSKVERRFEIYKCRPAIRPRYQQKKLMAQYLLQHFL